MAEIRANGVSEEFAQRFAVELAKRGRLSIREAVIAALEQWMGETVKAPVRPAPAQYPYPSHREAHEMLELILGADRKAADWIVGNLRMFVEALRSREMTKQGGADPHARRRAG